MQVSDFFDLSDFGKYDDQHRAPRQHSIDRGNGYMSPPLQPPTTSSSASHLYQQNYGLSRSVTLPESQHQSRRANSYNMPSRQIHNDNETQHDGRKKSFSLIFYSFLMSIDRHHGRHRRPSVETTR